MVKLALATAVAASSVAAATATTFMHEKFDSFPGSWVQSELKDAAEYGEWKHTAGKFGEDKGIQTGNDARFYGLSAKMDTAFDNEDKDLVVQFTAKHEQGLDCGGGYVKLLPSGVDAKKFGGDSPYGLMFGGFGSNRNDSTRVNAPWPVPAFETHSIPRLRHPYL